MLWILFVAHPSPGAEVIHLKQRLSESRQTCVQLEMQVATLKTEMAKLHGSSQALGAIRDLLTEETQELRNTNKWGSQSSSVSLQDFGSSSKMLLEGGSRSRL